MGLYTKARLSFCFDVVEDRIKRCIHVYIRIISARGCVYGLWRERDEIKRLQRRKGGERKEIRKDLTAKTTVTKLLFAKQFIWARALFPLYSRCDFVRLSAKKSNAKFPF